MPEASQSDAVTGGPEMKPSVSIANACLRSE